MERGQPERGEQTGRPMTDGGDAGTSPAGKRARVEAAYATLARAMRAGGAGHATPFGVLTARGARHMAIIVSGVVYAVHWDAGASAARLYAATPLEAWGWDSGAIVAPAADVDKAFK
ncbi:MAG: hypothetical protein R3B06_15420 [Kofleriaceae bacterium]